MNRNNSILEENFKNVLNEFYEQGLIQEVTLDEGFSDVVNKTKDALNNSALGRNIQNFKKNREFDKQELEKGTGNPAAGKLGRRAAYSLGNLALNTLKFFNGERIENLKSHPGGLFGRPQDRATEEDNARQRIIKIISHLLTLLYIYQAVKQLSYTTKVYKKDGIIKNNESGKLYQIASGFASAAVQQQMLVALKKWLLSGDVLNTSNDTNSGYGENYQWLRRVAADELRDGGSIDTGLLERYLKSIKFKLDGFDKEINEYIVSEVIEGLGAIRSDSAIAGLLEKKKNVLSSLLTEMANSILKELNTPIGSKTKDVIPYIFNVKNTQQFINILNTSTIKRCNALIEKTFYRVVQPQAETTQVEPQEVKPQETPKNKENMKNLNRQNKNSRRRRRNKNKKYRFK